MRREALINFAPGMGQNSFYAGGATSNVRAH